MKTMNKRGICLKLPLFDYNFEKPSEKTDQMVEQAIDNSLDEFDPLVESKESLNSLRSFSCLGQEMPNKTISYKKYSKLEEELKEKNLIIKDLQNSNFELKNIVKEIQNEK